MFHYFWFFFVTFACFLLYLEGFNLTNSISQICMNGEIQSQYFALETVISEKEDSNLQSEIIAKIYHTLSELALILDSDFLRAIKLHRLGKDIVKVMPPLPELHLNGKQCGGVADLYYVSAVIIKQMIDTNQDDPQQQDDKQWLENLTTLVTLTSDSGLPRAAEKHYSHALNILSKYSSSASSSLYQEYYPAFKFRAALLIPGAYSSKEELFQSRKQLIQRLQDLHYEVTINQMKLQNLDEFILSPTFYLIYYGFQDTSVLSALQSAYQLALPSLSEQNIIPQLSQSNTYLTYPQVNNEKELLRIGFVSSYFRKHSICKLFCQLIIKLHQMTQNKYDLYLFSSLQENFHDQEYTQPLIEISKQKDSNFHFISIGKPLIGNRQEITQRKIDILFYLDFGMEPSTMIWAAARLAPVQLVTWGHPSTTGLPSIDYYLSSDAFYRYPINPSTDSSLTPFIDEDHGIRREALQSQDFFVEQLVRFDRSLNFLFQRPSFDLEKEIAAKASKKEEDKEEIQTRLLIERGKLFYQQISKYLKGINSKNNKNTNSNHNHNNQARNVLLRLNREKLKSFSSTNKTTERVFYVLCPQYLPKFHPNFDRILMDILLLNNHYLREDPSSVTSNIGNKKNYKIKLLLLNNQEKKLLWQKTLITRWENYLLNYFQGNTAINQSSSISPSSITREKIQEFLSSSIEWIPSLSSEEYYLLVGLGDIMIDPFPFGGGVTTLEAFYVCTPVITLPSEQNVPQLTAGMIWKLSQEIDNLSEREEFLKTLIVPDQSNYLHSIRQLLAISQEEYEEADEGLLMRIRRQICQHKDMFYANYGPSATNQKIAVEEDATENKFGEESVQEWIQFFDRIAS